MCMSVFGVGKTSHFQSCQLLFYRSKRGSGEIWGWGVEGEKHSRK